MHEDKDRELRELIAEHDEERDWREEPDFPARSELELGPQGRYYAVGVSGLKDRRGNVRGGWLVYNGTGSRECYVARTRPGEGELHESFPGAVVLCYVPSQVRYIEQLEREEEARCRA